MTHCYECDFHDHDGASGYCNKFKTWTHMSYSCEDKELRLMKVKELIKLLSDDDFRVELVTDNYPYKWYKVVDIADVGYSEKEIVLDIEEIY